jgi:hypothetical protein
VLLTVTKIAIPLSCTSVRGVLMQIRHRHLKETIGILLRECVAKGSSAMTKRDETVLHIPRSLDCSVPACWFAR